MKIIIKKYKYSIVAVLITFFALLMSFTFFNNNFDIRPNGKLSDNQTSQNLGDLPMSEGIKKVTFTYTNFSDKTLQLNNLYTTCMCTKAKISIDDTQSSFAGMKGHSAGLKPINPNMTLHPGETVVVHAEFDPNAHGPDATGPITRSIILNTNDNELQQIEFKFSGIVTK